MIGAVASRRAQGRSRRLGTGFDHHRPENRHRAAGVARPSTAGRAQLIDTAATIAASSSGVGSPPPTTVTPGDGTARAVGTSVATS